jgi:hypothetical protein
MKRRHKSVEYSKCEERAKCNGSAVGAWPVTNSAPVGAPLAKLLNQLEWRDGCVRSVSVSDALGRQLPTPMMSHSGGINEIFSSERGENVINFIEWRSMKLCNE